MKIKRLLALTALGGALVGCGAKDLDTTPDAGIMQDRAPQQQASEVIDPLEKAATISAPESDFGEEPSSLPEQPESANHEEDGAPPSSSSSADVQRQAPSAGAVEEPPTGRVAGAEEHPSPMPEEAPPEVPEAVPQQPAAFAAAEPRLTRIESVNRQIEERLLRLINEERQRGGLEPLGLEESMQFAAGIRAREAIQSLSHTRPDGTPYYTAFDDTGVVYAGKWHGENLATITIIGEYDETELAGALYRQWRESPGHHSNILGEGFYQTGIGVHIEINGGEIQIGAAQLFMGL